MKWFDAFNPLGDFNVRIMTTWCCEFLINVMNCMEGVETVCSERMGEWSDSCRGSIH